MAGYQCPFCGMTMVMDSNTRHTFFNTYDRSENYQFFTESSSWAYGQQLIKCPNCDRVSMLIVGLNGEIKNVVIGKYPQSNAKQFPDYIPASIISDYEEACAIVDLSPKASATLSRRCLQGMIRDRWGIRKSRLIDEITELQGEIPAEQWKVIDGVRRIGNIGAHMEKDINVIVDIDSGEANKLIKLIEVLLKEWYIDRHEQELLYEDIVKIDEEKQASKAQKQESD